MLFALLDSNNVIQMWVGNDKCVKCVAAPNKKSLNIGDSLINGEVVPEINPGQLKELRRKQRQSMEEIAKATSVEDLKSKVEVLSEHLKLQG